MSKDSSGILTKQTFSDAGDLLLVGGRKTHSLILLERTLAYWHLYDLNYLIKLFY